MSTRITNVNNVKDGFINHVLDYRLIVNKALNAKVVDKVISLNVN